MEDRQHVVAGRDGQFHEVWLGHTSNRIRFDQDAELTLARAGVGVWLAVDARWQRYAIVPSHESSEALLKCADGREVSFPGAYGFGQAALRQLDVGCEVYLLGRHRGDGTASVAVYDAETALTFGVAGHQPLRRFDCAYSSMGFLQVRDDGTVEMVDDPPRADIAGLGLYYHQEIAGQHFGQAANAFNLWRVTPDGQTLEIDKTGLAWDGVTYLPSYLAVLGADVRVAVNGPHAPRPADLLGRWVPIPPRSLPIPVPPSGPPLVSGFALDIPGSLPQAWFGFEGTHKATSARGLPPGNFAWSECPATMTDERPVIEQISRWPVAANRELLAGTYGTDELTASLEAEIAAVKAKMAVPVIYLFCDTFKPDHIDVILAAIEKCKQAGVIPLPGIHVGPGTTLSAARVLRQRFLDAAGRYGMTFPAHFGWLGPEKGYDTTPEALTAAIRTMLVLHVEHPAELLQGFGWFRAGGNEQCPELEDAMRRLAAVITTPARRIGVPEPPPPVEPPATQPSPSRPNWFTRAKSAGDQIAKEHGGGGKTAAVVGTIAAALIALLARRKAS